MDRKLSSLLSLCRRAGALVLGSEACEKVIRTRKALSVIVCGDASETTKKKFSQKAHFYKVPYNEASALTKDDLSSAVGVNNCAVAVITDINFSGRIMEFIANSGNGKTIESMVSVEVDKCLSKNQNIGYTI